MTNFDKITQSPEMLANELLICDDREFAQNYCRDSFGRCIQNIDAGGDIDMGKCRDCLIDWLNQQAEGDAEWID